MDTNKIQIVSLWKESWVLFKKEWMVLVGFTAFSMIMNIAVGSGGYHTEMLPGGQIITSGSPLVSLVGWFISIILGMAGIALTLLVVRGKQVTKEAVVGFFTWTAVLYYFIASLLLSIVVGFGLLLLIIPGLYLLVKYMFALYSVMDKHNGPIRAMKHSALITRGNKWRLLGFCVTIVLLNVVGLVTLGIGLMVSVPMTMVATALVYVQLSDPSSQEEGSKKGEGEEETIEVESIEEGDTTDKK